MEKKEIDALMEYARDNYSSIKAKLENAVVSVEYYTDEIMHPEPFYFELKNKGRGVRSVDAKRKIEQLEALYNQHNELIEGIERLMRR